MNRLRLAALTCAVVGVTGWAFAQNAVSPQPGTALNPVSPIPGAQYSEMPGEVVSNGIPINPVGKRLPRVGKQIGQPINMPSENPLLRRYDPNNPYAVFKGTGLNASSFVTPANGFSQVAGTSSSAMQQLISSMKSFFGISTQPSIQRIYTPGIVRRIKKRDAERMQWRD